MSPQYNILYKDKQKKRERERERETMPRLWKKAYECYVRLCFTTLNLTNIHFKYQIEHSFILYFILPIKLLSINVI